MLPLSLREANPPGLLEQRRGLRLSLSLPAVPLPVEPSVKAHAKADRANLSASGARAKCATSQCRRCIPELRRLLRNSSLRDHAKSRRCEKLPALARAQFARRPEFRARRADRRELRLRLRSRAVRNLLQVRRRWKRSFAGDA